jgi:hypothetical protein
MQGLAGSADPVVSGLATDYVPRQGGAAMWTETGFWHGTPPLENEMLDCRQHSTLRRQKHWRYAGSPFAAPEDRHD